MRYCRPLLFAAFSLVFTSQAYGRDGCDATFGAVQITFAHFQDALDTTIDQDGDGRIVLCLARTVIKSSGGASAEWLRVTRENLSIIGLDPNVPARFHNTNDFELRSGGRYSPGIFSVFAKGFSLSNLALDLGGDASVGVLLRSEALSAKSIENVQINLGDGSPRDEEKVGVAIFRGVTVPRVSGLQITTDASQERYGYKGIVIAGTVAEVDGTVLQLGNDADVGMSLFGELGGIRSTQVYRGQGIDAFQARIGEISGFAGHSCARAMRFANSKIGSLNNIALDIPTTLDHDRHLPFAEGIIASSTEFDSIREVQGSLLTYSVGISLYRGQVREVSHVELSTPCDGFACQSSLPFQILSMRIGTLSNLNLTSQYAPLRIDPASKIDLLEDSVLQASTPVFIEGSDQIHLFRNVREVRR